MIKRSKNMKKLFALLLTVLMVVGMAACSYNEPATTSTAAPKATTPTTEPTVTTAAAATTEAAKDLDALPFVEPGSVKLTIGIRTNATVVDYDDNYTTKYLEEKTGIDIEFIFFSSDRGEAQQQLNLMIADKERLPDILFGLVTDKGTAKEMGDDGLLADISDLFQTSGFWINRQLPAMSDASQAKLWASVTNDDGSIYLFPSCSVSDGIDRSEFLVSINETMANNVGMKAAEIDTVAEVYEFLKKTVKEDGNGNGKADEIGMVIRGQDAYRGNGLLWVINAYVYMNDTYLWNIEDGKLWSPYITDEYRQALTEMSKWYAEGLISPQCWSIPSDSEAVALFHNPNADVVSIVGGHPNLTMKGDNMVAKTAGEMYDGAVILKDETGSGKGGYGVLRDPNNISTQVAFSADCENLELAFRLVDFMNEDTTQHVMRYGEEGVNWAPIDGEAEGLKDNCQHWAGLRILKDDWSTETKQTWHQNYMHFTGSNAYAMGLGHGDSPLNIEPGSRNELSYSIRWAWEENLPAEVLYNPVFNAEEQKVIDMYRTKLRNYIREARAEFISGVKDASNDADWNVFLKGLEQEGHDEVLDAYQTAYTRMMG